MVPLVGFWLWLPAVIWILCPSLLQEFPRNAVKGLLFQSSLSPHLFASCTLQSHRPSCQICMCFVCSQTWGPQQWGGSGAQGSACSMGLLLQPWWWAMELGPAGWKSTCYRCGCVQKHVWNTAPLESDFTYTTSFSSPRKDRDIRK